VPTFNAHGYVEFTVESATIFLPHFYIRARQTWQTTRESVL